MVIIIVIIRNGLNNFRDVNALEKGIKRTLFPSAIKDK